MASFYKIQSNFTFTDPAAAVKQQPHSVNIHERAVQSDLGRKLVIKEIVYKMRFDEASARYAEFGPFYTGYVASAGEILAHCLV